MKTIKEHLEALLTEDGVHADYTDGHSLAPTHPLRRRWKARCVWRRSIWWGSRN